MASVLDVITASAVVRDGRLYIRDRKEFDALVAQAAVGQMPYYKAVAAVALMP